MHTIIRWGIWFVVLSLFVFHCFWIIHTTYHYRKNVAEYDRLEKLLHKTQQINHQYTLYLNYQQSLYRIERWAKQQGFSKPQEIQTITLPSVK